MRKLFVLYALLLTICAKAQDYKPMLTDGKEWHCVYIVEGADGRYDTDGRWPYTIKVVGDSLINGTAYKKLLHEYTDSVPQGKEKSFCSAAIEKDRKVFDYSKSMGDVLVFDFNLHKGDIVSENTTATTTVTDEDYIEARDTKYRRLKVGWGGIWIEGIGCNRLDYTIPNIENGDIPVPYYTGDKMVACYDNGELIFAENDFAQIVDGINKIQPKAKSEDITYSINGIKLTNPQKGIYIKNGHKHVWQ